MENKTNDTDTLKPIVMFLVEPKLNRFRWAIVEGQNVVKRGETLTHEELFAIAERDEIADVFIDAGYRTDEILEFSKEYGWHCIFGKRVERDGLAQLIEQSCSPVDHSGA